MKKIYGVMLFWHWSEIMEERPENSYNGFILGSTFITKSASDALGMYSRISCPASQLIEASSREELSQKMIQMIKNFKNIDFVNKLIETL